MGSSFVSRTQRNTIPLQILRFRFTSVALRPSSRNDRTASHLYFLSQLLHYFFLGMDTPPSRNLHHAYPDVAHTLFLIVYAKIRGKMHLPVRRMTRKTGKFEVTAL